MTPSARDAMLADIGSALGHTSTLPAAQQAWTTLPRDYTAASQQPRDATLALLLDRLRDYDAIVHQATTADLTKTIQSTLHTANSTHVLAPPGFPAELLPATAVTDTNFPPADLDHFDTVITEATLAIAETGTLILQSVPGQGRRAVSLVPDTHLCLLRAADVVATVPEAIRRLQPTATLPTTFISGPSATADIEMTRIKGVHGPRFLHVILITESLP